MISWFSLRIRESQNATMVPTSKLVLQFPVLPSARKSVLMEAGRWASRAADASSLSQVRDSRKSVAVRTSCISGDEQCEEDDLDGLEARLAASE